MTGLDVEKDQILEMACLVTDSGLNILAEGPNLIINQPNELLDSMSDWCKEHHGKEGTLFLEGQLSGFVAQRGETQNRPDVGTRTAAQQNTRWGFGDRPFLLEPDI
ncbi:hypothetical protein L345_17861 [Ophiophagus hannah]|uniref:Exonuclease domain-containing protein n=1 Tax=Ophiophagus hannah TaxID=8665 RepID=V8N442_OPHHA|nr:hypothetical protein L345_17861 [Ophiophagus hannah]